FGGECGQDRHRFVEPVHLNVATKQGVGVDHVAKEYGVEFCCFGHLGQLSNKIEVAELFGAATFHAPAVLVVAGREHEGGQHHVFFGLRSAHDLEIPFLVTGGSCAPAKTEVIC